MSSFSDHYFKMLKCLQLKGEDDEMPVAEGEDDPGRVLEIKCVATGRNGTAGEIADAIEFARALKVYPVIRITK